MENERSVSITPREKEVLQHIAFGYKEKEISKLLFISKDTVKSHKRNLFLKLKVTNSASLICKSIASGLLSISETST